MTLTELPCTSGRDDVDAVVPTVPLDVVGRGLPVPLVTGEQRPYANFDYAASAPALEVAADHVAQLLPYYASVHRGAGYLSQVCTELYESGRDTISRFLGARADDVVVFTRNTTDALNLLASCVPGETVVLDIEHHANLLPWRRGAHRIVPAGSTVERTVARLAAELARRPAALLAVTGASNVTGEQLPLGVLAGLAHRHGARISVDAAQLVPHRRIDIEAAGLDYVALSGHKLYAPFGTGALVGRRDWLDAAPPYLAGGGAVREVTTERTAWAPAPARHEAGSANVVGVAGLARACTAIADLPEGSIEAHEAQLRERLVRGLAGVPGVRLLRIWPDSTGGIGVVAFTVDGREAGLVGSYLSAEHGIGVRDGRFCAHPLLARLNVAGGALRASLGLGSVAADVDRLVTALHQLVQDGPRWDYEIVDERYVPVPDSRPRPAWLPAQAPDAVFLGGAGGCQSSPS